jgi:hypothetical protein
VPGRNLPVVVASCGFHPGLTELSKHRALILDGCLGNLGAHPSNCASSYQWQFCLLKSSAIETGQIVGLGMMRKQFRAGNIRPCPGFLKCSGGRAGNKPFGWSKHAMIVRHCKQSANPFWFDCTELF